MTMTRFALFSLVFVLTLCSCSSADENIAAEKLTILMEDVEDNSDVSFEDVSTAYKADSICIVHAVRIENENRELTEYVMYVTPYGDDVFFTIDLGNQQSILTPLQTMKKQFRMSDSEFDRSLKKACVAYQKANLLER